MKIEGKEKGRKEEDRIKQKSETEERTSPENAVKIGELEDRLLRLQAEFENFRKRNAREQEALAERAVASFLLKLLPVIDDMELALRHLKEKNRSEELEGIGMIYKKLMQLLMREGLTKMDSLGKQFDPYYHEAVRQRDGEEDRIVDVIQEGYLFRGKVLRHAKVVVGSGKKAPVQEETQSGLKDLSQADPAHMKKEDKGDVA
ncbi:MAG: nucleotide exchange factor GrpE [Candidatus Bilamarchaeaceae archaeon]